MRSWGLLVMVTMLVATGSPALASASSSASSSASETTASTDRPSPTVRVARQEPEPPTADEGPVPGLVATSIHWTRWSRWVIYGRTTTLEGQVVSDDGAITEAEVDLYARRSGSERWRLVDTAVSSAETAVFAFHDHAPSRTTDYRVVFDGDLVLAGSEGDRRVPVRRRVRDSMRHLRDRLYVLRGSVAPTYRHRRVVLQRKTCRRCAWSVVDRTDTTKRSRWSFRVRAPRGRGTRYFRVVVPRSAHFARSYGDHVWSLRRR